MSEIKKLGNYIDALKQNRSNWDSHWLDIANHIMPRKGTFSGGFSPGQKIQYRVYDSTPARAAQMFASAVHTLVMNPEVPWFQLAVPEPLMEKYSIRTWIDQVNFILWNMITMSNFHSEIHETCTDFGLFGNSCMLLEEDPYTHIRFSSRPLSETYAEFDLRNKMRGIVQEIPVSPVQLLQMFPETCPEDVRKLTKQESAAHEKSLKLYHIVRVPRDMHPSEVNPLNPVESTYMIRSPKARTLHKGSFKEMPFFFLRYEVASGEVYARGPGSVALPEIKVLYMLMKHTIRAAQKATDPPLLAPQKNVLHGGNLNTQPGAINYYQKRGLQNAQQAIGMVPVGSNFPIVLEEKQHLREAIERAFFVDQLNLPMLDRMTAAEVAERSMSKQYIMAPLLGRLTSEFLEPMLQRVYMIAFRKGLLPETPQELSGKNLLKIRFTSPIQSAFHRNQLQSLQAAVNMLTPFGQVKPNVFNQISDSDLTEFVFRAAGAPTNVLRDPEEVAAEEAQMKQAAAQQQEAEAMQTGVGGMAGALKDVAHAGKLGAEAQTMLGM